MSAQERNSLCPIYQTLLYSPLTWQYWNMLPTISSLHLNDASLRLMRITVKSYGFLCTISTTVNWLNRSFQNVDTSCIRIFCYKVVWVSGKRCSCRYSPSISNARIIPDTSSMCRSLRWSITIPSTTTLTAFSTMKEREKDIKVVL